VYPIDFHYRHHQKVIFAFNIPEGYEVESLPEEIRVVTPGREVMFQFRVLATGNMIQVHSDYRIQRSVLSAEHYPVLRQLYDHMLARHGEQIVLRRSTK
ncbi:MAG: hypothetical protein AAFQ68_15820, partial [Bacteroidota bacterium]